MAGRASAKLFAQVLKRGGHGLLKGRVRAHRAAELLGGQVVGDITSADIKALLNHWMNEGYAYTTVKKVYNILTDYFRYLTQQEYIPKALWLRLS